MTKAERQVKMDKIVALLNETMQKMRDEGFIAKGRFPDVKEDTHVIWEFQFHLPNTDA